MPDISAAIRNAVSEKTAEIQRLTDQREDILYQAGLAQRRGRHKDSRCEDIKNICRDIADLNVARKRPSIPCEPHQIWVPRPHVPARACRSSSL